MHEITEFKGHKVIRLKRDELDKYGLTFGVGKAKLILDNIEVIRNFYELNKKEKQEDLGIK